MLYGVIISLYFLDTKEHHRPHIHAKYQEREAVVSIPDGEVLHGTIPANKMKLVTAWMEIHRDELMANWVLVANGQQPYRIEPLK